MTVTETKELYNNHFKFACSVCEDPGYENCDFQKCIEVDTIVNKALDLLEKQEAGLIIELPVPMGKEIYNINIYAKKPYIYADTFDSSDSISWIECIRREWGKTVFATREEAEAKLKELQNEKNNQVS